MAKVIPFPQTPKKVSQIVAEILDNRLTHRNPQVLHCLKRELKGLVKKHFSDEVFAATLTLPADLSDEQFRSIERAFQQHNDQLVCRTNALFLDLCLSRMTICELQYQTPPTQED